MSEADREHWDRRWASRDHEVAPSPTWLRELGSAWPTRGRALDVAAGNGRVALYVARTGLDVLAVDVSSVGLAQARAAARAEGLAIQTAVVDLEREPLPDGPFALVTCFDYLQRDLFPAMIERVAPGGILACEIATVENLERNPHPSRRFLLEPGELEMLLGPLELLLYREGWFEGRALARGAARRPAPRG